MIYYPIALFLFLCLIVFLFNLKAQGNKICSGKIASYLSAGMGAFLVGLSIFLVTMMSGLKKIIPTDSLIILYGPIFMGVVTLLLGFLLFYLAHLARRSVIFLNISGDIVEKAAKMTLVNKSNSELSSITKSTVSTLFKDNKKYTIMRTFYGCYLYTLNPNTKGVILNIIKQVESTLDSRGETVRVDASIIPQSNA